MRSSTSTGTVCHWWQKVLIVAAVVAVLFTWYTESVSGGNDAPSPTPGPAPSATTAPTTGGEAAALLSTLTVDDVDEPGYDRDLFGTAWKDVDGNGCDTRNDILRRDLAGVVYDDDGCTVLSGRLDDPYTGETISFLRGVSTSSAVQIDHVIALSNGWVSGMHSADAATREAFANDPMNLIAVDGPTNGAKGDKDAANWLPPQEGMWCEYVAQQVAVKAKYDLTVTTAERDAMVDVLTGCPGQGAPAW